MSGTTDDIKQRAEQATARFQARVAQVQHEAEAFTTSQERYAGLPDHAPATDPDEAAAQLQRIRARVDHDLDVLESRLPPTDTVLAGAKTYGGAAVALGGSLGAVAVLFARRRQQRAEEREAAEQADVLAGALLARLGHQLQEAVGADDALDDALEDALDDALEDATGRSPWWLAIVGAVAAVAAAFWFRDRGGPDGAGLWGPPTEG